MLLKMKRKEVASLCRSLAQSFSDVRNTKFAYALQKNIRAAKSLEGEAMKIVSPSDAFKDYENERVELCKKFALKDDDLNPIVVDGHYDMGQNKGLFTKEFDKLKFANGTCIREQEEKQKKLLVFLEEEVEVDFFGIKEDVLPVNLSIDQLDLLEPLLT